MHSATCSISILSGKGGVGKTNLAINLCYALYQAGNSVLLVDCDMGLANIDVLLGITPAHTLQDLLVNDYAPGDILIPIAPDELARGTAFHLLPSTTGISGLADMDASTRNLLQEKIMALAANYDFLFFDLGAGISPTVLDFGAMTDIRILVVTPEPTSLTDSYALMKVLLARYPDTQFHVLVNNIEKKQEAQQTYKRLSTVCDHFLKFTPEFLGSVRLDATVVEAVKRQIPLILHSPFAPATEDCNIVAASLRQIRTKILSQNMEKLPLRSLHTPQATPKT